jgi:phospho-N-acetylmuramoyl-pentapeptide-transferase
LSKVWLITAALLAFLFTLLPGKAIIKYLANLKYSQTILELGPSWHKEKEGTPTMGGIMFIASISLASVLCMLAFYLSNKDTLSSKQAFFAVARFAIGLIMALSFGLVGFVDDYIKISQKRNLGLTGKQKLFLQFFIAFLYLFLIHFLKQAQSNESLTVFDIPLLGSYNFGVFYWIISSIMLVGIVNAVNLTDGVDGLNASVTFFSALFLMMSSGALGILGMDIMSACLAGGCLGFLVFNYNPAMVFMGDTGSLFLGGMLCAITFGMDKPMLLVSSGAVYLVEMFSVMIQVLYFKATKGKRLFKMSPIHHHFEMCGWSEGKICMGFSAGSIIGGIISLLISIFYYN